MCPVWYDSSTRAFRSRSRINTGWLREIVRLPSQDPRFLSSERSPELVFTLLLLSSALMLLYEASSTSRNSVSSPMASSKPRYSTWKLGSMDARFTTRYTANHPNCSGEIRLVTSAAFSVMFCVDRLFTTKCTLSTVSASGTLMFWFDPAASSVSRFSDVANPEPPPLEGAAGPRFAAPPAELRRPEAPEPCESSPEPPPGFIAGMDCACCSPPPSAPPGARARGRGRPRRGWRRRRIGAHARAVPGQAHAGDAGGEALRPVGHRGLVPAEPRGAPALGGGAQERGEVGVRLHEVRHRGEVLAVLRPLRQPLLELLQRLRAEGEHLGAEGLAQRVQDAAQRDAQRDARHQLQVDEPPEQHRGDPQLLIRVLGEEAVLVEQVVHHAPEDVALARVARRAEPSQHLRRLLRRPRPRVEPLEVGVGLRLDVRGERTARGPARAAAARAAAARHRARRAAGARRRRGERRVRARRRRRDALELLAQVRGQPARARVQRLEEDGHRLHGEFGRAGRRRARVVAGGARAQESQARRSEWRAARRRARLQPLLQVEVLAARRQRGELDGERVRRPVERRGERLEVLAHVQYAGHGGPALALVRRRHRHRHALLTPRPGRPDAVQHGGGVALADARGREVRRDGVRRNIGEHAVSRRGLLCHRRRRAERHHVGARAEPGVERAPRARRRRAAAARHRVQRQVEVQAEPRVVGRAHRRGAAGQTLHRGHHAPARAPVERVRGCARRVRQERELSLGRALPRRAGAHRRHRNAPPAGAREHAEHSLRRARVHLPERLASFRLVSFGAPRRAGFAEVHHGLRPVGVRARLAQRVGGVFVVPRRRRLRRLQPDRRGERRERQVGGHRVERVARRRERRHDARELPRAERGHQADDFFKVLLARRAPVPELLDHLRGRRRGAQAGHDVAAGRRRHLRPEPRGLEDPHHLALRVASL